MRVTVASTCEHEMPVPPLDGSGMCRGLKAKQTLRNHMERNHSWFYKHSNGIGCFPPFLRNPFSAWMLFPSASQPCKQETALQPMLITATENRVCWVKSRNMRRFPPPPAPRYSASWHLTQQITSLVLQIWQRLLSAQRKKGFLQ